MKEDAEVGERAPRWDGRLYPSASATGSTVLPPFIWLLEGGRLMSLTLHVMNLFVSESASSAPSGRGPETNMSTYQTSHLNFLTGGKRGKTLWSVKKNNNRKTKKKKPNPNGTTVSEAWKVISDRTCQGFMGDLLRVMKKKGEKREISFTKTKQRLQKNAIRALPALPYKSIYMKVAEQKRFRGYN